MNSVGPIIDPILAPLRQVKAPIGSLRIAIDLSLLRPNGENGGIKPFIFEYLRELARREGNAVTFVFLTWSCSHADVRTLARPHDELVCVRHTEGGHLSEISGWRSGETLWLNPPPNLLVHLAVGLLYSPLSSAEFACPGIPTVVTVVDILHHDFPFTLDPSNIAVREAMFQQLVQTSDRFQCISSYTAERLSFHFGVEQNRTFRTYIVIQDRLGRGPRTGTRPASSDYFLFPANAWRHKNHETLLIAYRLYRHTAGSAAWDLVLTGHDDERMQAVLASARALGIGDSVRYFGHLSPDDFSNIWNHAGAMVFPSLHEGFGIPLLEAMHFGVPILSSRETSLPEIGAEAVLYADARDPVAWAAAMTQISTDADLRAKLVHAGKLRLSEFSLDAEAAVFCLALREAAAAGATRLWNKGIHIDGWTEKLAVVALPPNSPSARLIICVPAMPAGRRLRIFRGTTPFGGFDLPGTAAQSVEVDMEMNGEPLVLEVPDASNLNPLDHRCHGILVTSISAVNVDGSIQQLYPRSS